ncbi:MFS transporter [Rugamonas sp.]|uniref:MFS transporter n=1 Tax=Rugamonas sp. TaxID=1926287 RepID=UPI0025E293E4|nr:MFS transporter [Rugamonas sp.]
MNIVGPQQRLSTRLAFLVAGLAMSAWAPLVPYAKARVGLDDGGLGLLLLCLGGGSLLAMPLTGALSLRFGCRAVILWAGALSCLLLPGLAVAPNAALLAVNLFLFGAAIGTLDVAMNVQAVIVERDSGAALMSGFHGLFSVGGFVGAAGMALMLWCGLDPLAAALVLSAVAALVLAGIAPHLLRRPDAAGHDGPLFVMPHGAVILIGALCFIMFLAEGAMLDWSALFLTGARGLDADRGGLGYAAFACAMTLGRLSGDRVVRRLGGRRVLLLGGACAAGGFLFAVLAPSAGAALAGFVLIGLGASNIVPILFSAAGRQRAMPAGLAVSAITTIGYAGILAGPALIGLVAHASSLDVAFAGLGCSMLLVAACARLGAPARAG